MAARTAPASDPGSTGAACRRGEHRTRWHRIRTVGAALITVLATGVIFVGGYSKPAPASPVAFGTPSRVNTPLAGSFCSVTGDVCYGAYGNYGRPASPDLVLDLKDMFFKRFTICVTGPRHLRSCRHFKVHRQGAGGYGSRVRWSRHFPHDGRGIYHARWLWNRSPLGPPISFPIPFRVPRPPPACSDSTEITSACPRRPVPLAP
jgi:hypothetical protein